MKCPQCQQPMVTSKSLSHKDGGIPFDQHHGPFSLPSNVNLQGSSRAALNGFLAAVEQFECANPGCSDFGKPKGRLAKS
jgi:hypothetical protein